MSTRYKSRRGEQPGPRTRQGYYDKMKEQAHEPLVFIASGAHIPRVLLIQMDESRISLDRQKGGYVVPFSVIRKAFGRLEDHADKKEREKLASEFARFLERVVEGSRDKARVSRMIGDGLRDSPSMTEAFKELVSGPDQETTGAIPMDRDKEDQFRSYVQKFFIQHPDFLERGEKLELLKDYDGRLGLDVKPADYGEPPDDNAKAKKIAPYLFSFMILIGIISYVVKRTFGAGEEKRRDSGSEVIKQKKAREMPKHPSQRMMTGANEKTGEPFGPENSAVLSAAKTAIGPATGPFSWRQAFRIHSFLTRSFDYENVSNGVDPREPEKTLKHAKAGDCKSMSVLEAAMLESKGAETLFIDWAEPPDKAGAKNKGHEFLGLLVWHSGEKGTADTRIKAIRRMILRNFWGDIRLMKSLYPSRDMGPHFIEVDLHGRKEVYLLLDTTFGRYSVPGMAHLGERDSNLEYRVPYPASAIVMYEGKRLKLYDARPSELGSVPRF